MLPICGLLGKLGGSASAGSGKPQSRRCHPFVRFPNREMRLARPRLHSCKGHEPTPEEDQSNVPRSHFAPIPVHRAWCCKPGCALRWPGWFGDLVLVNRPRVLPRRDPSRASPMLNQLVLVCGAAALGLLAGGALRQLARRLRSGRWGLRRSRCSWHWAGSSVDRSPTWTAAGPGAGRRRPGVPNKSPIASNLIFPMIHQCGSRTRRFVRHLFVRGRGALRREFTACLRAGRALRVPRARCCARGKGFITDEVLIRERPAEADDRALGSLGGRPRPRQLHHRYSLVERTTRFTMLLHLPRMAAHGAPRVKNGPSLAGHGAEAVRDAIASTIITLPEQLRRSLNLDQGAQLAQHAQLRIDTGLEVYFCNPHSPASAVRTRTRTSSCVNTLRRERTSATIAPTSSQPSLPRQQPPAQNARLADTSGDPRRFLTFDPIQSRERCHDPLNPPTWRRSHCTRPAHRNRQRVLGHRDIRSTLGYAELREGQVRPALCMDSPPGPVRGQLAQVVLYGLEGRPRGR